MTWTEGLIRPDVSAQRAREVAREQFGVDGEPVELGSQQDRNYRIGDAVLKVAHPSFSDAELDAQDAALLHLAGTPGLAVPVPQRTRDGGFVAPFDGLRARLLTYVPGVPLAAWDHLAPVVVGRLGAVAGRVAARLADLEHPGLDRLLQWDLRQARAVCEELAPYVPEGRREVLVRAAADACDRLDALAGGLRVQPVHGDVTDDNVVCARGVDGRAVPTGVIDLGDVGLGWLVGDLAATCASVLHHAPGRPLSVLPAVRAYAAQVPLHAAEVEALWPGIVARAAVLVASGCHQGAIDPGNAYAVGAQEREWQILATAAALPAQVGTAALREALGLPVRRVVVTGAALVRDLPPLRVLDRSVTTEELVDGAWLDAPPPEGPSLARWGEARLTRTRLLSREAPATVALGVELTGLTGAVVQAPFDGVLDGSRLRGDGLDLLLDGVSGAPGPRRAGEVLGTAGPVLRVQCCPPGVVPPAYARPEEAPAWLAVCPDPSPLLGVPLPPVDDEPAAALLHRRRAALAAVQEHYYAEPPRIERGWREHLVDAGARTYLDAVNNVASCGHAHPVITRAAARQWGLLNTNSRFHYRSLADFSARLAALLPEPLDTVLLVNSGSEAVDLALRLARTATGRDDVLCVAEAYHGWTLASDAVSTSRRRQPAGADHPARLGAPAAGAQRLPRGVPRGGRRAALRRRRAGPHRRARGRRPPAGGLPRRGLLRQRGRHRAARRLPDRRVRGGPRGRRAVPGRRGAGGVRPARRARSGASSSRGSCPTS